jgi:4'-phosphopantetheinyl transferase
LEWIGTVIGTGMLLFELALEPWTTEQDRLLAMLPDEERERILRLRRSEDRSRALIAALLPRLAIGARRGIPISAIGLPRTAAGKPYAPDERGLCFNLSHSGSYVALAMGPSAVGIDIEQIRTGNDCDAIAARFFAPDERDWLQRFDAAQRRLRFFELWSRKESILKATGEGLAGHLAGFSTVPDANQEQAIEVGEERWWVRSYHDLPGYSLAVSTTAAGLPRHPPIRSLLRDHPDRQPLIERASSAVARLLEQLSVPESPA